MTQSEQFQFWIDDLCEVFATDDPYWVSKMRENPVVWGPHRPYGKYSSEVFPGQQPKCCEFAMNHSVHALTLPTYCKQ